MVLATKRVPRPRLVAISHRLASCVIVSGFRAALDLNTYPLRNLIRPRCAERAKPGRGKPVLIMHIGFFACFHTISLERSCFSKIASLFLALVALKQLVSLIRCLVACSARIVVDRQTDTHRTTTVTLAAHACRGLTIVSILYHSGCVESSGQMEWKLQSVVDNTQLGSAERVVEKMKLARKEVEGERDRVMAGKQQAEGERDRAMVGKQQAEGERDRAMAGKQEAEGERNRAMAGKQQAEGERDRAMVGKQQAEGERDRAMVGKQQAEGERDRVMAGKQQAEGEMDRTMAGKQQAERERDRAMVGKQKAEGERDRAMTEKQQAEGERDRAMAEKQRAEGERDRAMAGKQQAEGVRDWALMGKQQAEGARDWAMAGKQQAEGARDWALMGKQQAEGARDWAMAGKQRVEGERDRALQRAQLAETRANNLQRRLDEVEGREHERLVVKEQAIAAEQRGPSWEVKEEDLQATGDVIGIGGWAEVKVAHLKVAAKYMHRQLVHDYHHRLFRREMDVAARVSHPNLLRFLGAKLQDEDMAILTELMPTSLRIEVNKGHRNPDDRLSLENTSSPLQQTWPVLSTTSTT